MTDVNLSDYKNLYLQTARKYIADLQTSLTALETDTTKKEAVETVYISAHSLKSQSQIMTYVKTGALSGTIEALFRTVHEGTKQLNTDMLGKSKEAVAQIAASVDSIEKENKELDLTQYIEAMKQFTTTG
jgi:two-component system chemotaxis sensor kinase CheA